MFFTLRSDITPSHTFSTTPFTFSKKKHPHQIVHKHQHADNTEQGDIKPGRCQQMHQRRNFCTRFLKETEKHRHLSQKGKSVIKRIHKVSTNRSVTTVPKDLENDTSSYLARTPQRDTSPTRGNIKLVA